jgi:aryl-alcohol dehydrogenase-like predicted oxidoreductase
LKLENQIHTKIAIGTVQFGLNYGIANRSGQVTEADAIVIINYCKNIGINTIDTAYAYGNSETVLGKADVSDLNVITKFLPYSVCGKDLKQQFSESLIRLQSEKVYGLLAHRFDDILNSSNLREQMKSLKEEGLVEKIGVSLNAPEEMLQLLDKGFIPDIIQAPYNYFDSRFEKVFKILKSDYNVEIHTRSAFLQGLFFANPDELSDFFNPVKKQLRELQLLDGNLSCELINYVLNENNVDKVVIGVDSLEQLKINVENLGKCSLSAINNEITNPEILTPSNWPK